MGATKFDPGDLLLLTRYCSLVAKYREPLGFRFIQFGTDGRMRSARGLRSGLLGVLLMG
ncbi:hypothetical protein D3C86_2088310 [compost metagenome]